MSSAVSPDPGQLPSPPSGDPSAGPSFPGVFPRGHSPHPLLPGPRPPGSPGTGRSLSLQPQVGRESCGPWPLSVLAWRPRRGHGDGRGATGLWGLSAQREGSVEADGGGKKRKGRGTNPGAKGKAGLAEAVGPLAPPSPSRHTHAHMRAQHACAHRHTLSDTPAHAHTAVHKDTHPCAHSHRVSTYIRTRPHAHAYTLIHIPVGAHTQTRVNAHVHALTGTHSARPVRTSSSGCDTHADREASVGRWWPGWGLGDSGAEVKSFRYLGENRE